MRKEEGTLDHCKFSIDIQGPKLRSFVGIGANCIALFDGIVRGDAADLSCKIMMRRQKLDESVVEEIYQKLSFDDNPYGTTAICVTVELGKIRLFNIGDCYCKVFRSGQVVFENKRHTMGSDDHSMMVLENKIGGQVTCTRFIGFIYETWTWKMNRSAENEDFALEEGDVIVLSNFEKTNEQQKCTVVITYDSKCVSNKNVQRFYEFQKRFIAKLPHEVDFVIDKNFVFYLIDMFEDDEMELVRLLVQTFDLHYEKEYWKVLRDGLSRRHETNLLKTLSEISK